MNDENQINYTNLYFDLMRSMKGESMQDIAKATHEFLVGMEKEVLMEGFSQGFIKGLNADSQPLTYNDIMGENENEDYEK